MLLRSSNNLLTKSKAPSINLKFLNLLSVRLLTLTPQSTKITKSQKKKVKQEKLQILKCRDSSGLQRKVEAFSVVNLW